MFTDSDLFSSSMENYFDDPFADTEFALEDLQFFDNEFQYEKNENFKFSMTKQVIADIPESRKRHSIKQSGHKRCPSAPMPSRNKSRPSSPSLLAVPDAPAKVPARHRQNSLPAFQSPPDCLDQEDFDTLCLDEQVTFNPVKLGFQPKNYWSNTNVSFGDLVKNYFRKKTSSNCRFIHKLNNALKISSQDSFYAKFVGVMWINDKIFKVDKYSFARLLGIKAVDGSLFHKQGNFPSHGFVELTAFNIREYLSFQDISDVDYENTKVFTHPSNSFTQMAVEDGFEDCSWISTRPVRH